MDDWVVDFGGTGEPIVLLHGLMGRATCWWSTAQWLRQYGHVVGPDARAHGRNPVRAPLHTEAFVADVARLTAELGPATVIGHSMGGLHALGLAATRPDLVRAVVVEDMAVDQRGRTVEPWKTTFDSWPESFTSLAQVRDFFGSTGDYFIECMTERAGGYRLMADFADLFAIAAEWGERDFSGYLSAECPVLLIEAEHSLMPPGQLAAMAARLPDARHVVAPGAGHWVHGEAPEFFRGAVEAFLAER